MWVTPLYSPNVYSLQSTTDFLPKFDPYENLASAFSETHRRQSRVTAEVPASAGGINKMSEYPPGLASLAWPPYTSSAVTTLESPLTNKPKTLT